MERIIDDFLSDSQYSPFECLMGDCLYNKRHFCRKIEPSIENGKCLSCESTHVEEVDTTMPFEELIRNIQATRDIRVELHNLQGNPQDVPHIDFIDTDGKIQLQISFCKDGGIVQREGYRPIGIESGERLMSEEADYREPERKGAILIGVLKVKEGLLK